MNHHGHRPPDQRNKISIPYVLLIVDDSLDTGYRSFYTLQTVPHYIGTISFLNCATVT